MSKMKFVPWIIILSLLFSSSISIAKSQEYRVIINFQYDQIIKDDDTYVVQSGKSYGLLGSLGNVVMKLQSSPVDYGFNEGLAQIVQNKKYGFIDKIGKIVISPKWDYAFEFWEGLASVELNYKYGFIDTKGVAVIKPQWDFEGSFSNGVASVMICNKPVKLSVGDMVWHQAMSGFGRWGLIDRTGKVLIEPKWNGVINMAGNDKLIIVSSCTNGTYKYGIADCSGKFLINPVLDEVTYFEDGYNLSPIKQNGKWGFMDRTGKIVTKFEWDEEPKLLEGSNNLWQVDKENSNGYSYSYGAVDDRGSVVIEPDLSDPPYYSDGMSKIAKSFGSGNDSYELYCYTDANGKVIREPLGYTDAEGNKVKEPQWSRVTDFSDGIAWVYSEGNSDGIDFDNPTQDDLDRSRYCWRPIDKSGQYLSQTGWDKVTDFNNGYAAVTNEDGKSTIIDKNLNKVCKLGYNVVTCLSGDSFIFEKNKKYGMVDKTNTVIYQPEWKSYDFMDYLKYPDKIKMSVTKENWSSGTKSGLIGKSDKLVCNTYWDLLDELHGDLLKVKQNDKWGLVNVSSEALAVTPQFEDLRYLSTEKGESIWQVKKNGKFGVIAVKI